MTEDLAIVHLPSERRFVATVDGQDSILSYSPMNETTLDYNHTFVPEALRGRGIAGRLAKHALDYLASRDLSVVPSCPYIARYIERHPEYQKLVAA